MGDIDAKDLIFLGGIASLWYGCYMIYPPLAWIAVGVVTIACTLLASRRNRSGNS